MKESVSVCFYGSALLQVKTQKSHENIAYMNGW
jgi:hypothetical protein